MLNTDDDDGHDDDDDDAVYTAAIDRCSNVRRSNSVVQSSGISLVVGR